MKLDGINKWLTLLANLGVVGGLILLTVEIRQNQTLLEQNQTLMEREYKLRVAENVANVAYQTNQFRLVTLDPDIAELWLNGTSGHEFDAVDQFRFKQLCSRNIWTNAVQHNLSITLDDLQRAEAFEKGMRERVATENGTRACWEQSIPALRQWGFDSFVDGVLPAESP
jgi:hypothetical protein